MIKSSGGISAAILRLGTVLAAMVAGTVSGLAAPAQAGPAIDHIGTVAWGANEFGQLGDQTVQDRLVPVQVHGMASDSRQVASGLAHSLLLTSDGRVWAWGANADGQLGIGNNFPSYGQPQRVGSINNIVQIAANDNFSMALRSDGRVFAWGNNYQGRLGDGTIISRNVPVPVLVLGVRSIVAGGTHAMAIRHDGTVWAWGDNMRGQLTGFHPNHLFPVQVNGIAAAVQIAAGYEHSLVLLSDGTVLAWGDNRFGQLGDGLAQFESRRPVVPIGLSGVALIGAGAQHSMACASDIGLRSCTDAKLFGWGRNDNGQLGDGTATTRVEPVVIKGVRDVLAISGGLEYTLIISRPNFGGSDVLSTGANYRGQLGDGSTAARTTFGPTAFLKGTRSIAAGGHHCLAVTFIEPVICCG